MDDKVIEIHRSSNGNVASPSGRTLSRNTVVLDLIAWAVMLFTTKIPRGDNLPIPKNPAERKGLISVRVKILSHRRG